MDAEMSSEIGTEDMGPLYYFHQPSKNSLRHSLSHFRKASPLGHVKRYHHESLVSATRLQNHYDLMFMKKWQYQPGFVDEFHPTKT